jgi:hypothetical protein
MEVSVKPHVQADYKICYRPAKFYAINSVFTVVIRVVHFSQDIRNTWHSLNNLVARWPLNNAKITDSKQR